MPVLDMAAAVILVVEALRHWLILPFEPAAVAC
jgi:hypothetical protein